MEQALMQMQHVGERGGGGIAGSSQSISEEQLELLKEYYGFDKPDWQAYLIWLGAFPSEGYRVNFKFEELDAEKGIERKTVRVRTPAFHVMDLDWDLDGWLTKEEVPAVLSRAVKFKELDIDGDGFITADECAGEKGIVRKASELVEVEYHASMDEAWILNPESLMFDWEVRVKEPLPDNPDGSPRAVLYLRSYSGILQGELGNSFRYGEKVTAVIAERLPVSTFYGLMTVFLTYLVSLPLGIWKAVRHNSLSDNLSSIFIFMGYAIPGYVLGALLVVFAAVKWRWFPAGGFVSEGFEGLSTFGKCMDILHHAALPLLCYMIGSFAFVTMLMKNHLMDNLASDYIRTALAKGVEFKDAVKKHALRNSFIPIATNIGHQVTLFVAGSFLIENVFDINGFGLLGFTSVIDRDYPVVMGVVLLSAVLMLVGNILSDVLVAIVDPRVRFH